MTITEFCEVNGITLDCNWVNHNPYMPADDFSRQASHFQVILRHKGRRLVTYFSLGAAHNREPEVDEVLSCLLSDASSALHADTFLDWCYDLGYDPDSRLALRTYDACAETAGKLEELLGEDLCDELLNEVEPL